MKYFEGIKRIVVITYCMILVVLLGFSTLAIRSELGYKDVWGYIASEVNGDESSSHGFAEGGVDNEADAVVKLSGSLPRASRVESTSERRFRTTTTTQGSGPVLEVHFIDVGQALSILVVDNQNNHLLYDCGDNDDGDLITDYLKSLLVDDIEYLVSSHPHHDHIGGMDDVLEAYSVEQIIMSPREHDTKSYTDAMRAVKKGQGQVLHPKVGMSFEFGDALIEVVGPMDDMYQRINDYSIMLKISIGDQSILLTGDAEAVSEREVISSGQDISATILQVGHHGSESSSTTQFLKRVNADYSVISCGADNDYGFPQGIVLNRLNQLESRVLRTDLLGTIIVSISENGEVNIK